ncbi:hypothetical protein F4810DRAFT_707565 [Camillea tinctor]|nr:hypothetical protein F4810DRAFT_707565 [Camillea tinctor]
MANNRSLPSCSTLGVAVATQGVHPNIIKQIPIFGEEWSIGIGQRNDRNEANGGAGIVQAFTATGRLSNAALPTTPY